MTTNVDKFYFRLVLLGSHGTGKTSILNRFLFKKYEIVYKPTVEDLFSKSFDLGSIEVKVDFLDTSGSMQFPAMRRLSITTGNAFLIVYAVDDETSYDVLKMCIAEIREIRPDFQEIPIVFAGNKCDIPRERQKVLKETVSNYVHYDLPRLRTKVIECSCKDNINIDNIFKAYLSLAKVSLSTSVVPTNLNSRTNAATITGLSPSSRTLSPTEQIISTLEECHSVEGTTTTTTTSINNMTNSRRASSMKVVLGVRKSCDASIVYPNLQSSSSSSSSTAYNNHHKASSASRSASNEIKGFGGQQQQQQQQQQRQQQPESKEVNLETAIQSKLNAAHVAKPRSRSLIWRPNRKSQRSSNEPSDCRVS